MRVKSITLLVRSMERNQIVEELNCCRLSEMYYVFNGGCLTFQW